MESNKENNVALGQDRDTGLALLLILLLFVYFGEIHLFLLPAIVVLVAVMTWPVVFKPLSKPWFWFSHLLGNVVTKVILTMVYIALVIPIGRVRRMLGSDAMRRKSWKDGAMTAFVNRDHVYSKNDLEKPY